MKNKFENYTDSRLFHELKYVREILYKPWVNIIIPFILLIAEGYVIYLLALSSLSFPIVFLSTLLLITWMGGCLLFIYGYITAIRDEENIISELTKRGKDDLL